MDLDLTDKGLGVRSRRYAMLVDDGAVSPGHCFHVQQRSSQWLCFCQDSLLEQHAL